jgi:hypothetical protein
MREIRPRTFSKWPPGPGVHPGRRLGALGRRGGALWIAGLLTRLARAKAWEPTTRGSSGGSRQPPRTGLFRVRRRRRSITPPSPDARNSGGPAQAYSVNAERRGQTCRSLFVPLLEFDPYREANEAGTCAVWISASRSFQNAFFACSRHLFGQNASSWRVLPLPSMRG